MAPDPLQPISHDPSQLLLDGPRGEDSIAELCRREGIVQNTLHIYLS